jgi:hypothetical protein
MNNDTGRARVSLEQLADESCHSVSTLQRGRDELKALGLLKERKNRKRGEPGFQVSIYWPLFPKAERGGQRDRHVEVRETGETNYSGSSTSPREDTDAESSEASQPPICIECGGPSEPFFSTCRDCIEKEEVAARKRDAKLIARGKDDRELRGYAYLEE